MYLFLNQLNQLFLYQLNQILVTFRVKIISRKISKQDFHSKKNLLDKFQVYLLV